MKHRKSLLAVILAAVLLTFAVSGTVAYLKTQTEVVVNTFTPAKVDTEVVTVETADQSAISSIKVENKPDSILAYVRVAVAGNWCDADGKIVEPWEFNGSIGSNWKENGDFYYYNESVAAGALTENLLSNSIDKNYPDSDLHLEVTVMQQAIQAEPGTVVEEMWGINPTTLQ